MAFKMSSDFCGARDMVMDISGKGGERGAIMGASDGDRDGLAMSSGGRDSVLISACTGIKEAGGTSIKKLTCMCLFILDPFIPCHTAGPALCASGTGPGENRLEDNIVGDPGQDTGGETDMGAVFRVRGALGDVWGDICLTVLSSFEVPSGHRHAVETSRVLSLSSLQWNTIIELVMLDNSECALI